MKICIYVINRLVVRSVRPGVTSTDTFFFFLQSLSARMRSFLKHIRDTASAYAQVWWYNGCKIKPQTTDPELDVNITNGFTLSDQNYMFRIIIIRLW